MDITPNIDIILNLREQVEVQSRLVADIKRDGLRYYRPHVKQSQFHAAAEYRYRAVFAGNRFGKSMMGSAEDCAWLRGERVWLSESDPLRRLGIPQHPVKGLVITTDWDKVDEIWTTQRGDKPGKIWRFLPQGFVGPHGVKRNHSGAIDTVECVNGSMLRFDTVKSYMANPQGSESSDWDFIHVDEPCPEGMWKAASRGLMDRRGKAWFTLTPLSEPWIRDFFDGNPTITWSVYGNTYDNTSLSREAIDEYSATLTEDERQCRINGIPLFLSGLVYKEFDRVRHVLKDPPRGWDNWLTPPENYSLYYNIDPHPQTPHAVLFCAVSPYGQRFYYHDLFIHTTISQLCATIKELTFGRRPIAVRVDPWVYQADPITNIAFAEEFHRCGIPVERASKDLSGGILKVQAGLKANPGNIYFSENCQRTLWEIARYRWDEKGTNKPIDKDDHMMENLYRMELSEPRWIDTTDTNTAVDDIIISHAESLSLPQMLD